MDVYVCVTLYHVYITLLKIISDGRDKDRSMILLNANNEQIYKQYKYIYKQLISNGYICDLRLRKRINEILGIERIKNIRQLSLVKDRMRKSEETDFTLYNFAWNNSYVYSTASLLYKKCNRAVFIEESTMLANVPPEKVWKKILHKLMGGVDFYKDDKLIEICVQKPEFFPPQWEKKLSKLDIDKLQQNLTERDKNLIIKLMSEDGEHLLQHFDEEDVGIVYTGPFSEDKLLTEKEKIDYIMRICNFYQRYGKVVLKLHPRDTSEYPVGSDILVLPASFPSELLALTGYQFKFAVAICSSAVNTTKAEYKINMIDDIHKNTNFILKDIEGLVVKEDAGR